MLIREFFYNFFHFAKNTGFSSYVCHFFEKKRNNLITNKLFLCVVGVRGFEPPASSSRTKRATGLRYTPKNRRQK